MIKAIFLDRDGVINADLGYVYKIEDFHFIDGVFDFCTIAQQMGYLLIVITNQAGIARGYFSEEDFLKLDQYMTKTFADRKIIISETFYCPYHPKGSGEYRADSFDRKPNPGMILKAAKKFNIDLANSVLIGDKASDTEAGRRAGVGKLFFLKGSYPAPSEADVSVFNNFSELQSRFKELR